MQGGIAGFGGGRKTILTALMWIVLIITVLNWTILIILFFVSQAERTVTISWYLSPYWWMHLYATGTFTAATLDSIQPVSFIFKPSVAATVLMGLATVVDLVGGYFYIIDYWGQCLFSSGGLSALQKIGCDDERLYVWMTAVGAGVAIVFAFFGFVLALWDSVVRFTRTQQFSMVSGHVQKIENVGSGLASGVLGRFAKDESVDDYGEPDDTYRSNVNRSVRGRYPHPRGGRQGAPRVQRR